MPIYGPPKQLAECMRSGVKCLASELVRDGRNPHLLVLPRYYDPPQEQERPFKPDDAEGRARFPLAPDHGDDDAPVLSGEIEDLTFEALLVPHSGTLQYADDDEYFPLPGYGSISPDPATVGDIRLGLFFHQVLSERVGLALAGEGASPSPTSWTYITFLDDVAARTLIRSELVDEGTVEFDDVFRRYWHADPFTAVTTSSSTYTLHISRGALLTWTQAGTIGPRVETYKVYRATGSAGAFSLLETLPVDFGAAPDYTETHTLTLVDSTVENDTLYRYRIDAVTEDLRVLASNVIELVFTIPTPTEPPVGVIPPSAPVLGGSESPVEV